MKEQFNQVFFQQRPGIIPSEVRDKSKFITETIEPTYQKQGTYQCQVKEFGALNFTTSNAIVLTHSRVMNGIVTIQTASRKIGNKILNHTDVMNTLRNFVHQVCYYNWK